MCKCFEKISTMLEEKCLESVKNEAGFQEIEYSGFVNSPWLVLDSDLNVRKKAPFFMPFEITYTRKSAKSGNVREYKKKINFFPSHCPMCGEAYDK